MTTCVHCQSADFHPAYLGYGFDDPADRFEVVECRGCRLVTISPFPTPAELAKHYRSEYYGAGADGKFAGPVESAVRWAIRMSAARLLRTWNGRAPARVLDIGCGRGAFLNAMAEMGLDGTGTEIAEFPAEERGRRRRFELLRGVFEELPIEPGSFDLVSIWHVLEHVANPATTMAKISRTLRPGGMLALAVPNYSSIQRTLFGKHWFHFDIPRHLYHFRRDFMLKWLQENGLIPVRVETFSLEQNLFGFIQSFMNLMFGARSPNAFYKLMKRSVRLSPSDRVAFLGYSILAALLLPLALVEALASAVTGRGATLIVYARKDAEPAPGGGR